MQGGHEKEHEGPSSMPAPSASCAFSIYSGTVSFVFGLCNLTRILNQAFGNHPAHLWSSLRKELCGASREKAKTLAQELRLRPQEQAFCPAQKTSFERAPSWLTWFRLALLQAQKLSILMRATRVGFTYAKQAASAAAPRLATVKDKTQLSSFDSLEPARDARTVDFLH